jgi:hypothetical protein
MFFENSKATYEFHLGLACLFVFILFYINSVCVCIRQSDCPTACPVRSLVAVCRAMKKGVINPLHFEDRIQGSAQLNARVLQ